MTTFEALLSRLRLMTEAEVRALGKRAGVPEGTLMKLKYNQTKNPRVLTVQRLLDHIDAPLR